MGLDHTLCGFHLWKLDLHLFFILHVSTDLLNIMRVTAAALMTLSCLVILTSVSYVGQFQLTAFFSSLWVVYSCPPCLVIFGWMPDTINLTLLDVEYVCALIIVLRHCLGRQLSRL